MRFHRLVGILIVMLLCGQSASWNRVAAQTASNPAGDWRLVGPKEAMQDLEGGDVGRITAFTFHPSEPNTIYAATPAGGLWRTQDDGVTWGLVGNHRGYGIQDVAIDPLAPATMYILTGDGEGSQGAPAELGLSPPSIGVLKSIDSGQTWTTTGLTWNPRQPGQLVYGYRLVIDPKTPAILIAATTKGLFRTADGGQTWSSPVKSGTFWDLQFHPTDPSVVYAASTEVAGGSCSMDVYRSTDAGQTWTKLAGGLPSTTDCSINARVRLAVTPASPDTVYVLYGSNTGFTIGLYRSDDRGNSFKKRSSTTAVSKAPNAPLPIDLSHPNIFGHKDNDFYSQSFYSIAMAVSPSNADLVYVGAVDTWRSEDGGQTWKRMSYWILDAGYWGFSPGVDQYVHADIHMLASHNGSLYAATDGGIYRSTDGGGTWASITKMNTGITIAQLYDVCSSPLQPDTFYYGAQDNGTYRLDINGETLQMRGGDGYVCQVDPRYSNTVYLNMDQQIYRTDDAAHPGAFANITPTVQGQPVASQWVTPYILAPANAGSMYACYADLWFSSDRGLDWQNLTNGALGASSECRQVAISPADANTIYVAKEAEFDQSHRPGQGDSRTPLLGGGGVFRSTNGGATWQSITGSLPLVDAAITNLAVSSTDARRVWVTFEGYNADVKVFGTTNGGETWTNLSSGLPNNSAHAIAVESGSTNPVYVGMDDGVYYRDDTLARWMPFKNGFPQDNEGIPIVVTKILIQEAQHRLVAATFSRGVWVSDLHAP